MDTLERWLRHLETIHPREMDLGLTRIRTVWERLGSPRPAPRVVTVAGTNGKGSVVAVLEAVLRAHGLRTGVTTSPHLYRFNERIRIDGEAVSDALILEAFRRIEAVRDTLVRDTPVRDTPVWEEITLTYFEFAILAALDIMARAEVDVAILEVGLGGRLDAVNLIDADVAVITCIGLDHEAWLGDDRESIGYEKAGVIRAGRPVVCGERDPPASVLDRARGLDAPVFRWQSEFRFEPMGNHRRFTGGCHGDLRLERLPPPELLPSNVACALQAAALLPLELDRRHVHDALDGLVLPGRMQRIAFAGRDWILDVAHNPHAVAALRQRLGAGRNWVAVLGVFRDKRVDSMVGILDDIVNRLYLVPTPGSRGQSAAALAARLDTGSRAKAVCCGDVAEACERAIRDTGGSDAGILVLGSFTVVAAAGQWLGGRADGSRGG